MTSTLTYGNAVVHNLHRKVFGLMTVYPCCTGGCGDFAQDGDKKCAEIPQYSPLAVRAQMSPSVLIPCTIQTNIQPTVSLVDRLYQGDNGKLVR